MTKPDETHSSDHVVFPLLVATLGGLAGYAAWYSRLFADPPWRGHIWPTCVTLGAAVAVADLAPLGVQRRSAMAFARGFSLGTSVVLLGALPILLAIPWLFRYSPVHSGEAWIVPLLRPHFFLLVVVSRIWLIRRVMVAGKTSDEEPSWFRGVAVSPSALLFGLSPGLVSMYVNWHPAPAPAAAAIEAAYVVMRCSEAYTKDHGGRYPKSLAVLATQEGDCLGQLARGDTAGWSIRLQGDTLLRLIVRERNAPLRTYRSFFSDASGVLFTAGYSSRDATTSDYALGPIETLRIVGHCLNLLNGLDPRHLPVTLWGLSPRRSACSAFTDAIWSGDGDSSVAELRTTFFDRVSRTTDGYRYEYRAWLDKTGDADSADVSARPALYGRTGIASYLLAWDGEIHATSRNRAATRSDPEVGGCQLLSSTRCLPEVFAQSNAPSRDTSRLPNAAPVWSVQLVSPPPAARGVVFSPLRPVVSQNHSVVVTSPVGTYAYDAFGKRLWARSDVVTKVGGLTRGPGTTTLVVDSSGQLHALTQQGVDQWKVALNRPAQSAPVLAQEMIYVVSDSALHAVSIDGQLRWEQTLSGPVFEAAAADDGGVYVHRVDRIEHYSAGGERDAVALFDSLQACAGDPATNTAPSVLACTGDGFRASLWAMGDRRFMRIPEETGPSAAHERLVLTSDIRDDGSVVDSREHQPLRAVAADLSIRWRIPGNATDVYYNPVVLHSAVACIVSDRRVAWIDEHGVEFAGTDLGKRAFFSKLAADPDGVVYLLRDDATLFALRLPSKQTRSP